MLHTLWAMAPMICYLIVVGAGVFVAGWWACVTFDEQDDWVFFGGQGAEHDEQ